MDDFPIANRTIIRRLQLPSLMAVTGQEDDEQAFCNRFEQVLAQGIRMVQLRAPFLSADEFRARAHRCAHLCRIYNAKLLLNAEPELVTETEAAGFHASSARLMQLQARPVSENHFFSASCHNLEQLQQAERLGVDFVLLSPVLETASHPEATPLGWERFKSLAGAVSVPCYALGGVRPADLGQCRASGGIGIAAVGAFW
jgi:8-oxo-dGTP diphosphatase